MQRFPGSISICLRQGIFGPQICRRLRQAGFFGSRNSTFLDRRAVRVFSCQYAHNKACRRIDFCPFLGRTILVGAQYTQHSKGCICSDSDGGASSSSNGGNEMAATQRCQWQQCGGCGSITQRRLRGSWFGCVSGDQYQMQWDAVGCSGLRHTISNLDQQHSSTRTRHHY